MEFFVLYLFVMLEQIAKTLIVLGNWLVWPPIAVAVIALVICGVAEVDGSHSRAEERKEVRARWYKFLKTPVTSFVVVGVLLITIGSLLPTPKQAAIIFGGGMAYQAVTSDKGQEVLGKVGAKVEAELDKLLSIPEEKQE